MNNKKENYNDNEKLSPLYFNIQNIIKNYLDDNNIKYEVNNNDNIELFTSLDYKNISTNITTILTELDNYTIDNIEFLWSKNLIIKLENNEILNIFCHIKYIDEIKQYIKNILNLK